MPAARDAVEALVDVLARRKGARRRHHIDHDGNTAGESDHFGFGVYCVDVWLWACNSIFAQFVENFINFPIFVEFFRVKVHKLTPPAEYLPPRRHFLRRSFTKRTIYRYLSLTRGDLVHSAECVCATMSLHQRARDSGTCPPSLLSEEGLSGGDSFEAAVLKVIDATGEWC